MALVNRIVVHARCPPAPRYRRPSLELAHGLFVGRALGVSEDGGVEAGHGRGEVLRRCGHVDVRDGPGKARCLRLVPAVLVNAVQVGAIAERKLELALGVEHRGVLDVAALDGACVRVLRWHEGETRSSEVRRCREVGHPLAEGVVQVHLQAAVRAVERAALPRAGCTARLLARPPSGVLDTRGRGVHLLALLRHRIARVVVARQRAIHAVARPARRLPRARAGALERRRGRVVIHDLGGAPAACVAAHSRTDAAVARAELVALVAVACLDLTRCESRELGRDARHAARRRHRRRRRDARGQMEDAVGIILAFEETEDAVGSRCHSGVVVGDQRRRRALRDGERDVCKLWLQVRVDTHRTLHQLARGGRKFGGCSCAGTLSKRCAQRATWLPGLCETGAGSRIFLTRAGEQCARPPLPTFSVRSTQIKKASD